MPSIRLRNPESGVSCEIERGLTCLIEASTLDSVEALLAQLLGVPESQVAHGAGGLVNNVNVLENVALPVIYHRVASIAGIEPSMPIIVVLIDLTRTFTFHSGSHAIFGSVGRAGCARLSSVP